MPDFHVPLATPAGASRVHDVVREDNKLRLRDDPALLKRMLDRVPGLCPELFRRFYPRQYENIGGYYSPKSIAVWLTMVAEGIIRHGIENAPTAHQLLAPGLQELAAKKMPMLFIAPKL